jgi:hypothetical protein
MSYYISFDLMIEFIYLMDEEGDSHPTSNSSERQPTLLHHNITTM